MAVERDRRRVNVIRMKKRGVGDRLGRT